MFDLRVVALVLLPTLAPAVAHATPPAPAVTHAPVRFDIRPPARFRPSDAVERLVDAMATGDASHYRYHAMLYPRMTKDGTVITVHTSLLHDASQNERAGLNHILGFAKSNHFSVSAESLTPEQTEALRASLRVYGAETLVQTR